MFIDILFLIIVALAVFKGLRKGLIMAIFSMVGLIIGLAAALKLSVFAASKISAYSGDAKWLPVISFAFVFIAVIILVNIAGIVIEKAFQLVMLGWANRLGGVLLYIIMYSIIFSIFLFYAVQVYIINKETISASFVYPYLQPLGLKVMGAMGTVIPWFKNMIAALENFFAVFAHA